MANWYVVRNGNEQGPVTSEDLKQLAATGRLQPDDLVRREDQEKPTRAGKLKGLFQTAQDGSAQPNPVVPPPLPEPAKKTSKNLLTTGLVGGGIMMFLCCGGLGILGVIGNNLPNAKSSLADYYPFKAGTKYQTVSEAFLPNRAIIEIRKEVSHEEGGIIRIRTLEQWMKPGANPLPLNEPSEERYRLQNGFVEIGHKNPASGEFFWEPVIRIGAKEGDTWKSDATDAVYKFVGFQDRNTEINGKLKCAVVEQLMVVGTLEIKTETAYAKGYGPVIVSVESVPVGKGITHLDRLEKMVRTDRK